MSNYQSDLDPESDELIRILVDKKRSSVERTRATQQLYHRHTSWVIQQVGKKIYNPDDVQDCLLYTSPSPRDATLSRMPSSA